MVSELLRLTTDERIRLTTLIVEYTAGRGPVFAGVGAESAKKACEHALAAHKAYQLLFQPLSTDCRPGQRPVSP